MAREKVNGCPSGAGTVKPEHGGQIGNPPHERDEEIAARVREFAELCNQEETARRSGISLATLHKYYHDDWQAGADATIYDMKAILRKQAVEEKSVNAAKALLQVSGAYVRRHEHSAPGGGPIRTVDLAILAQMVEGKNEQELTALEQALALVLAATGAVGGPDDGPPDAGVRPGGETPA